STIMSKLTYIAGVLLLATAVTAQATTTNDPLAIINAAKSNLAAMKQKEDTRKTPIAGISADCQAAISGLDVNPECIDDIETDPQDQDFAARCAAPADGAKDHRCSNDQVLKALDTLESKCKAELDAKNANVMAYHTSWQTYSLSEEILCSKSTAGKYCILDASDKQCTTNQLNLIKDWKAPRPDKYTNDSASTLRTASANLAKQNNVDVAPSNKTSGTTGTTGAPSTASSLTTGAAALTAGVLAVVSMLM
ncbi:hypothetical protein BDF22DRAFT_668539, partial [Syncephalis plumigaleata]